MNITCGSLNDRRIFNLTLPDSPSKIAVLVSGGIDSALLYYLIHLENRFTNELHTITPLTVMRKEGSKYFAQGVVDKIHEIHNLPQTPVTIVGDNTLPEDEQVKSAVKEAHTLGFDVVYCGVIEQLPQHMVNWQPIPSKENEHFKTPLQNLNKGHIINLCVQTHRRDLFPITHSCSRLEMGRCNECNGCNERKWGFEQNKIQEPEYPITIKEQVKFIHEFLQTDFEKGFYMIGGSLTYLIALEYGKVSWNPNDIDLCYTEGDIDTYNRVHGLLASKSKKWETFTTPLGYTCNNYYIPGFIRVSLQATKLNYKHRVQWTDYSVCAIGSDRHQTIMHNSTRDDIKNKILNRTGAFRKTEADSKINLERRYRCYTGRGFLDEDNKVWKQAQEFLKENNYLLDTETK